MKINFIKVQVERAWDGDGMRGRHDDNIRTGTFTATVISSADADILSSAITLLEAEEQVTGTDRGTYACQILEACEDGHGGAISLDQKINEYLKATLSRVEYVEVTELEGDVAESTLPKVYLGREKLIPGKFRDECKKFGC